MRETRKVVELKPAPMRHEALPPSLVARIESLHSTLDEVYPQSMAEWLDGFQRDTNPEQEVLWWENLAACYLEYSRGQELNSEQRKAAFNVMLKLLFNASREQIAPELLTLPPTALDDILDVMSRK